MGILSKRQRMGVAAIILAISALLSRLMGLIRDKIISWQFGASGEADMYFAAFVVPDIINYLLAGAFMSITIIPLLGKGFAEDETNTWRFFSCVFFWLFLCSLFLTGCGEIWAEHLAKITAPGFTLDQSLRLAFFMRIILPAQIFFLSGSCFTALLLLRRQFATPALTPLIYNGCIILFGLILPLFPGLQHTGMTGYCVGVTIGAAIGAFILPFIVARKGGLQMRFVWRHAWIKNFLYIALPLMLGQTVVMLDEQFLRVFGSMLGEGQVSLLNYGRRIAQVPVALMGQAIAVASYPFLVKLLAKNDLQSFDSTLRSALASGVALIIPCALWMAVTAAPILGIIFQGGRFGLAETLACEPLTQILLLSTPLWIIYMVLARGYYAYGDTLTPAITGTIITLICIPLYYFCAVPLGAWAIASLSGISIAIYVFWLMAIWIKRYKSAAFVGIGKTTLKSLACGVPAAVLSWLLIYYLRLYMPQLNFMTACAQLAVSGITFAICFLILAKIIAPEIIEKLLVLLRLKKA